MRKKKIRLEALKLAVEAHPHWGAQSVIAEADRYEQYILKGKVENNNA